MEGHRAVPDPCCSWYVKLKSTIALSDCEAQAGIVMEDPRRRGGSKNAMDPQTFCPDETGLSSPQLPELRSVQRTSFDV